MASGLRVPETGRGTAEQLTQLQGLARHSLVLSVTRRCPLRCEHCITSSGPDLQGPSLSLHEAEAWAHQLPELWEAGVRHITFTGGEPILALEAVSVLSACAAELGMETAVVTSAAWATSSTSAAKVIEKLGAITHWDIGYDAYHANEIPFLRIEVAIEALKLRGRSFSLRVCVGSPLEPSEAALLDRLRQVTGPSVPIFQQSVRRIGRAVNFTTRSGAPAKVPREPCISTGPFVREDGTVGPCCSGLAYEAKGRHPFEFGSVQEDGLAVCRERWMEDPLLRLVRLVGFAVPLGWLKEGGLGELLPAGSHDNVCELCVALWDAEGRVGSYLRYRASRPEVVVQLDRLEAHLWP